jgi:hypothetical protein
MFKKFHYEFVFLKTLAWLDQREWHLKHDERHRSLDSEARLESKSLIGQNLLICNLK